MSRLNEIPMTWADTLEDMIFKIVRTETTTITNEDGSTEFNGKTRIAIKRANSVDCNIYMDNIAELMRSMQETHKCSVSVENGATQTRKVVYTHTFADGKVLEIKYERTLAD